MWRRTRGKWLLLFLAYAASIGWVLAPTPAFAANSQIETSICSSFIAPTITEPAPTTTDSASIIVAGTGEPNMTVSIRDNGTPVGSSMIAGDGSYALQIPLVVGDNILVAQTANACETKNSSSVTVHRNAPPQPPAPSDGGATSPPTSSSPTNESPIPGPASVGQPAPTPSIGQSLPTPIPEPTKGYQRPIITEPRDKQTFTTQRIWLSGKAAPFSTITVYVNGVVVATTTADEQGVFGTAIQLRPGDNTLQVRAAQDKKVAFSDSITVQWRTSSELTKDWFGLILVILILLGVLCILWYTHRRFRRKKDA